MRASSRGIRLAQRALAVRRALQTTASSSSTTVTLPSPPGGTPSGVLLPTVSPWLASTGQRRSLSTAAPAASEKHEFHAETKNLLDIVAKSLYSNSEVFIRELISNASDALEKRRFAELAAGGTTGAPGEIRIITDQTASIIRIEDSGIGMNREDLIAFLGTIAHSGSKEFIKENAEKAEAVIGQFGVGFYSAFMVADRVKLRTRKLGETGGLEWTWNGDNTYEVADCAEAAEGTSIEIHLKSGDAAHFAEPDVVKQVIHKYSYFVNAPILVNGERVNSLNAIWTSNPKDVTKEQHDTFFKQLAKMHQPHLAEDRPSYYIHYKADSPMSIRSIMYIPSHKVSQLEFASQQIDCGLSLYARRVLIKPNAKELLPRYLRFIIGVVDSEDVPLNLSREMLQNNPVLIKLRRVLTEKVLSFFVQQQKKDLEKYTEFYRNYCLFFKEGIVIEPEQAVKEEIARLLMFESSDRRGGSTNSLTSLASYVSRMQEGQKEIYYMYAPSRQLAESSPYFEVVKGEGKEVIFLLDPADEVVFLTLGEFSGHKMMSVENWAKDQSKKAEMEEKPDVRDGEKKELFEWVKNSLGSVKVHDVVGSHRPSEHPAMISMQQEIGAARHFLRMGEAKDMEHLVFFQPTFHVHLSHPLIQSLRKLRRSDEKTAKLLLEQIYDNALITAGLMNDTRKMVPRLNDLLTKLAGSEKSTILTP